MNKLLYWIAGKLPCRIISDDGQPYLERYYVATIFGVRIYLHRFVGSDPARGLHCHPWPWAGSVILSGWYNEETRSGMRCVRWFNWLTGDSFHRVILPADIQAASFSPDKPACSTCWTLFFHRAAYVKPWGFLNKTTVRINHGDAPVPAALLWLPWNSAQGGDGTATSSDWWLTAPKGRDSNREAA